MIKIRLSVSLESWIQKTQYGFRRQKSASQALFLPRRLLDIAERQGTKMTLVRFDWEKAFDKINQAKLPKVLTRAIRHVSRGQISGPHTKLRIRE